MRTLVLIGVAAASALSLAACASYDGYGYERPTAASYRERQENRLERQCYRRGGILVPSGRLSGDPALDNYCSIHGTPRRYR
jgi:hypothetical protein